MPESTVRSRLARGRQQLAKGICMIMEEKRMDRAELIKALQTDVEIPEVVQDKAKAAFDKNTCGRRGGNKQERGTFKEGEYKKRR